MQLEAKMDQGTNEYKAICMEIPRFQRLSLRAQVFLVPKRFIDIYQILWSGIEMWNWKEGQSQLRWRKKAAF